MELLFYQQYWWFLVSLLGAILVFLLFVQGGQSMILSLAKSETEKKMMINSLGRKWEFTFTTLVTFGGAFFASFPLFYSVSFGGAYWVWMLILFSFVLQAVSYEFRSKENNLLGAKTYEVFLVINGFVGTVLIGTAVSTFFTGAEFVVNKSGVLNLNAPSIFRWTGAFAGLEAALDYRNLLLGLAVLFLSRTIALLYFVNNIADDEFVGRIKRPLVINSVLFLLFFLVYLGIILTGKGYAVSQSGDVSLYAYKYFINLVELPGVLITFLLGVCCVLYGIGRTILNIEYKRGIWFSGVGTVLTVLSLLLILGWNNTAYYPSKSDLNSSLTIVNSSSSLFTLQTMSIVSLIIPFVLGYIFYAWRALDKKKIDAKEMTDSSNHAY